MPAAVEDLVSHRKGYTIRIPRSKTDQEGQGREVDLLLGAHDRTCPVLALENWLKVANIKEGRCSVTSASTEMCSGV